MRKSLLIAGLMLFSASVTAQIPIRVWESKDGYALEARLDGQRVVFTAANSNGTWLWFDAAPAGTNLEQEGYTLLFPFGSDCGRIGWRVSSTNYIRVLLDTPYDSSYHVYYQIRGRKDGAFQLLESESGEYSFTRFDVFGNLELQIDAPGASDLTAVEAEIRIVRNDTTDVVHTYRCNDVQKRAA